MICSQVVQPATLARPHPRGGTTKPIVGRSSDFRLDGPLRLPALLMDCTSDSGIRAAGVQWLFEESRTGHGGGSATDSHRLPYSPGDHEPPGTHVDPPC